MPTANWASAIGQNARPASHTRTRRETLFCMTGALVYFLTESNHDAAQFTENWFLRDVDLTTISFERPYQSRCNEESFTAASRDEYLAPSLHALHLVTSVATTDRLVTRASGSIGNFGGCSTTCGSSCISHHRLAKPLVPPGQRRNGGNDSQWEGGLRLSPCHRPLRSIQHGRDGGSL